jgi:putative hemolysin
MQPAPVFGSVLKQMTPAPVAGALGKILRIDDLDRVVERIRARRDVSEGLTFAEETLRALGVEIRVRQEELARIPRTGPVVVVANHPYGMLEAAALSSMLERVRPDAKVIANHWMGAVEELRDKLILVDTMGGATQGNSRTLRSALAHLGQGGLLVVFPAGEVSHWDAKRGGVADPEWSDGAARMARATGAQVSPVYFAGANGWVFQVAGMVHPRLRTALLPHELLSKKNRTLEIRVGHALPPDRAETAEMRRRTYWLGSARITTPPAKRRMAALGAAAPAGWIQEEIERLDPTRTLAESGEWRVILAKAWEAPLALREIGRLREETFRGAGEGTGCAYDLDRFDNWYHHLVLWNHETNQIGGAYRLCGNDEGRELYTETLFRSGADFRRQLGPALELGRSFVRREYQRGYQPLLLLWRGIGEFVARNPKYRRLFGAVSISADYGRASRQLMARYLRRRCWSDELANGVEARVEFRAGAAGEWPEAADLEDLDHLIGEAEAGARGVPVLLRHYLKLGGRLCALGVDAKFGSCVDGLVVVDLLATDRRQLERYLGRAGAGRFYSMHCNVGQPE